jgi:hypothetical protein
MGGRMPTAKPQYDRDGRAKYRRYSQDEWDELHHRVRPKLKPFYKKRLDDPDTCPDDSVFLNPADEWASCLLEMAAGEVSTAGWLHRRLSNEELRAEQADVVKALEKAIVCLTEMSEDFSVLLPTDVDHLESRDKLRDLVPHVVAAREKIGAGGKAKTPRQVQYEAAKRIIIGITPLLRERNIPVSATAQKDFGEVSDAIKILRIIGTALGLSLAETTWKGLIIETKPSILVE